MKLNETDLSSMRSMITSFPILLGKIELSQEFLDVLKDYSNEDFSGICLLGMGGSAIAGRLSRNLLLKKSIKPLICIQDYHLPFFVDSQWIVIATSYSGNTEETLSAVKEAIGRNCRILGISSGGQLSSLIDDKYTVRLPTGFQPRAALPILFSVLLRILETILKLQESNLQNIGHNLLKYQNMWSTYTKTPRELAKLLEDKVPLFIGASFTEGVAYRAKCQVNENAKSAAFYSILPEANHNEIESIAHFDSIKLLPIFIRSMTESDRLSERIEATSQIYGKEVQRCEHLRLHADSEVEEILHLIFYLDMLSLELSEILGVNPLSVERISTLKKILSNS